jgi:hypothetical protein
MMSRKNEALNLLCGVEWGGTIFNARREENPIYGAV